MNLLFAITSTNFYSCVTDIYNGHCLLIIPQRCLFPVDTGGEKDEENADGEELLLGENCYFLRDIYRCFGLEMSPRGCALAGICVVWYVEQPKGG